MDCKKKKWLLFIVVSIPFLCAFALDIFVSQRSIGIKFRRFELIALVYVFIVLNIFLDRKKLYDFLFKYRWYCFIGLFVFCVLNKFNFSSVGSWNDFIQSGLGSDYTKSVFGVARSIRSDDWLVGIPRSLSSVYTNFSSTNDLARATEASNISVSGLQLDFASLCLPQNYGYYLFGAEYGFSYAWCYKMIFGFAFCHELFLILTKNKKLLSFFGTILIWFSSFNVWWSLTGQLLSGTAIIVLFYYFIIEKKTSRRLIVGMLLAIAGADYVVGLYPAWQVPMGYIILSIMVWILITNNDWKKYTWKDWLVFVVDVLFMVALIARYFYLELDYIQDIQNTVYPGSRVDYGGMTIQKLLGYFGTEIAFLGGIGNPCEVGTFYAAYPLGIILMIYVQIKQKGKNILMWCLTVPMVILVLYCTVGLPEIICKLTLLTNSVSGRAVDFLGVIFTILMIISLSEMEDECKKMPFVLGTIVSAICVIPAYKYSINFSDSANFKLLVLILAIITFLGIILLISEIKKKQIYEFTCVTSSVCLLGCGMGVNPIMVGLDAVLSKPAAKKVQEIVSEDSDAIWIGTSGSVSGNFLLACGAKTINSVNYVPNFEMWKKLDPDKKYEEVWNRYAHINIELSGKDESEYRIDQADSITMSLCKADFDKLDIKYILSQTEISGQWSQYLEEIYDEAGVWIYKVIG